MKLLVTGAVGTVGAHLGDAFNGDEMVLTDVVDGWPRLDVRDRHAVHAGVAAPCCTWPRPPTSISMRAGARLGG